MVEIKVDTKKDSEEEIRKVIRFLEQFLAGTTVEENTGGSIPDGAFNIFSDTPIKVVEDDDDDSDEPSEDKTDDDSDDEDVMIKPIFY